MTPPTTTTLTTAAACTCDDCTAFREALSALDASGALPPSLVHDDGSPVLVAVGDAEVTAAEAYLRLALLREDLDPTEIRRVIGRLRELDPTDIDFPNRYAEARKLVASLDLVKATR